MATVTSCENALYRVILAGANVEHAYLGSNVGVLVLLTALIGNLKKQQYPGAHLLQYFKILSLKFDEM